MRAERSAAAPFAAVCCCCCSCWFWMRATFVSGWNTSALQSGQALERRSHSSTHDEWNVWQHAKDATRSEANMPSWRGATETHKHRARESDD